MNTAYMERSTRRLIKKLNRLGVTVDKIETTNNKAEDGFLVKVWTTPATLSMEAEGGRLFSVTALVNTVLKTITERARLM